MISLNERAWELARKAIAERDRLNVIVQAVDCGSRIVDAGVNTSGGLEAGLVLAEISCADLLAAQIEPETLSGIPWPWVAVRSDFPYQACSVSQTARWNVNIQEFRAMGSGPACLLNHDLINRDLQDFQEHSDCAVLVLETRQMPDDVVCRSLAKSCGVHPDQLAIFLAPTSSLAGSVQIAARSIETGMHKLNSLGFDVQKIVSGAGRCPMAAPAGDDYLSLGRTNDLMMFASQVWMSFRGVSDDELAALTARLPASASLNYGLPFLELLRQAGGFYELDPGLFAPAEVTTVNLETGSVYHAGKIDTLPLEKALKG
jgi:methenyltetrahydromethanopterin cyclohydrolase